MWVPNTDPSGSGLIADTRFNGQEGAAADAPMHSHLGVLGVTGFLMQDLAANPLDYVEGGPLNAPARGTLGVARRTNPDLSAFAAARRQDDRHHRHQRHARLARARSSITTSPCSTRWAARGRSLRAALRDPAGQSRPQGRTAPWTAPARPSQPPAQHLRQDRAPHRLGRTRRRHGEGDHDDRRRSGRCCCAHILRIPEYIGATVSAAASYRCADR